MVFADAKKLRYIAREFLLELKENGLRQHRIKPHCPEKNGAMERANRTLRERLGEVELTDLLQSRDVLAKVVKWYKRRKAAQCAGLHAAGGVLPRRSENPPRREEEKNGGSLAPEERKKPGVETANDPFAEGEPATSN